MCILGNFSKKIYLVYTREIKNGEESMNLLSSAGVSIVVRPRPIVVCVARLRSSRREAMPRRGMSMLRCARVTSSLLPL